jgi:hypothetical protein
VHRTPYIVELGLDACIWQLLCFRILLYAGVRVDYVALVAHWSPLHLASEISPHGVRGGDYYFKLISRVASTTTCLEKFGKVLTTMYLCAICCL